MGSTVWKSLVKANDTCTGQARLLAVGIAHRCVVSVVVGAAVVVDACVVALIVVTTDVVWLELDFVDTEVAVLLAVVDRVVGAVGVVGATVVGVDAADVVGVVDVVCVAGVTVVGVGGGVVPVDGAVVSLGVVAGAAVVLFWLDELDDVAGAVVVNWG